MSKVIQIYTEVDFKSPEGLWVKTWNTPSGIDGVLHKNWTLSMKRWNSINSRCNKNEKQLEIRPGYRNVQNKFKDYQSFVEWSVNQVGYKEKDYRKGGSSSFWILDKDLLSNHSKEKFYSEDRCLFVPNRVNLFTVMRERTRGNSPIGTSWSHRDRVFETRISLGSYPAKHLGNFKDAMDGHRAWQKEKIAYAHRLAEEFQNSHTRLSSALLIWIKKIENDLEEGRESIFVRG